MLQVLSLDAFVWGGGFAGTPGRGAPGSTSRSKSHPALLDASGGGSASALTDSFGSGYGGSGRVESEGGAGGGRHGPGSAGASKTPLKPVRELPSFIQFFMEVRGPVHWLPSRLIASLSVPGTGELKTG